MDMHGPCAASSIEEKSVIPIWFGQRCVYKTTSFGSHRVLNACEIFSKICSVFHK